MQPIELARLSKLLDTALDLEPQEQAAWLESLSDTGDAPHVPVLRRMLARAAVAPSDDVLGRGPAFAAAAASAAPRPGELIGPYRLIDRLGEGGMGAVWLAERADGSLRRKVALKLPHTGWTPGLAERFARECEILSSLEHPHIARLYDAGVDAANRPYMALEHVEGSSIDAYCREHALTVEARIELLLQVAQAVAYAHGRLVVHRDLKPGNVLVTADGQVRLLDFGIAKLLLDDGPAAATALTAAAGRAMTPDYASPEQLRGERIGTSSDIYSLGVVAYELLAGVRPRRAAQGPAQRPAGATDDELPPASRMATDPRVARRLAGDLDAILAQALRQEPGERYATVDALAQDLRRHLTGQRVLARADTLAYRGLRLLRRHRLPLASGAAVAAAFWLALGFGAAAVVILALIVGLAAALWQARQAARSRDRALALAARNEAVNDFLETLLLMADTAGKPMTPQQMLRRSEELAERDTALPPDHRAMVLALIGMRANALGDSVKGEQLLQRARQLSDASGDVDLRDLIRVQLAFVIGVQGRRDEALAILEPTLARDDTAPETRSEVHRALAMLGVMAGQGERAVHHAQEALRWLGLAGSIPPRRELQCLAMIATACSQAGRNDEGERHYAAYFDRIERLGLADSPIALPNLSNWAVLRSRRGDVQGARELLDRYSSVLDAQGPETPRSPIFLMHLADIHRQLGNGPLAEQALLEGLRLARAQRSASDEKFVLVAMAALRAELGDLAGAQVALRDSLAIDLAVGPAEQNYRLRAEARIAVGGGAFAEADAIYTRLIGERPLVVATLLGLLGRSAVRRALGDFGGACADAREAVAIARALQGTLPASIRTGEAWLAVARAEHGRGGVAEAQAAAAEAIAQLEGSVGASHPLRVAAQELSSAVAR